MHALALTFALLAALAFAGAFVAQQHVSAGVDEQRGRGLRLFRELAKSPLWWVGALGDGLGFVLQAVALAWGNVVVVQPVLVTAMVFALPLAAWWNGRRLTVREGVWAVVVVAGLAVFTVVADAGNDHPDAAFRPWIVPLATATAVCAGLGLLAWRTRGAWRALALGSLTGVVYGVVGPLTELVVSQLDDAGVGATLTQWPLYLLVLCVVVGTACQQAAFHAGELGASLPATQVLEPAIGVVFGVWALGASLGASGWGWAAIAVAAAAMAAGTVALAHDAATR